MFVLLHSYVREFSCQQHLHIVSPPEKDNLLEELEAVVASDHKNFSLWYAVDKGSEGEEHVTITCVVKCAMSM